MVLDKLDFSILRFLARNGRASHVEIGKAVGLSPTACARRIKALEDSGVLKGSVPLLDMNALGFTTSVLVRITLESQRDEGLRNFEKAVARCPDVLACWLMSGVDDYILHVVARDIPDYERIHKQSLSKLPGVSRIQSSFALRTIVERSVSDRVLNTLR